MAGFLDGSGAYTLHLYNEWLRRDGINKNTRFDELSLFEQLKAKHNIANLPDSDFISPQRMAAFADIALAKRKNRINRERTLYLLIALLIGIGLAISLN